MSLEHNNDHNKKINRRGFLTVGGVAVAGFTGAIIADKLDVLNKIGNTITKMTSAATESLARSKYINNLETSFIYDEPINHETERSVYPVLKRTYSHNDLPADNIIADQSGAIEIAIPRAGLLDIEISDPGRITLEQVDKNKPQKDPVLSLEYDFYQFRTNNPQSEESFDISLIYDKKNISEDALPEYLIKTPQGKLISADKLITPKDAKLANSADKKALDELYNIAKNSSSAGEALQKLRDFKYIDFKPNHKDGASAEEIAIANEVAFTKKIIMDNRSDIEIIQSGLEGDCVSLAVCTKSVLEKYFQEKTGKTPKIRIVLTQHTNNDSHVELQIQLGTNKWLVFDPKKSTTHGLFLPLNSVPQCRDAIRTLDREDRSLLNQEWSVRNKNNDINAIATTRFEKP